MNAVSTSYGHFSFRRLTFKIFQFGWAFLKAFFIVLFKSCLGSFAKRYVLKNLTFFEWSGLRCKILTVTDLDFFKLNNFIVPRYFALTLVLCEPEILITHISRIFPAQPLFFRSFSNKSACRLIIYLIFSSVLFSMHSLCLASTSSISRLSAFFALNPTAILTDLPSQKNPKVGTAIMP